MRGRGSAGRTRHLITATWFVSPSRSAIKSHASGHKTRPLTGDRSPLDGSLYAPDDERRGNPRTRAGFSVRRTPCIGIAYHRPAEIIHHTVLFTFTAVVILHDPRSRSWTDVNIARVYNNPRLKSRYEFKTVALFVLMFCVAVIFLCYYHFSVNNDLYITAL